MEMTKKRRTFSPEFKEQAVKRVINESRTVASVAQELQINDQSLWNWVRAYRKSHAGDEPAVPASDRERLAQLEAENRELRLKNEFLGKAAAFFAKEYR